tara:strand:+ start:5875 stop:6516 length:642 start_codon:yes stop_codon:yes gene_type:complete
MLDYDTGAMCDVIDVTLYKFNHYDNLIWTRTLNQLDYIRADEASIVVTPFQLQTLFDVTFKRELRRLNSTASELIHRDAHSLFFLTHILSDFTNLKWIQLTLNKKRNFSRLSKQGQQDAIKYSYKVLKTTLRLTDIFPVEAISSINPILKKADIFRKSPYVRIKANVLLAKLDSILDGYEINDDQASLIGHMMDLFDYKLETDNPDILLVTDW